MHLVLSMSMQLYDKISRRLRGEREAALLIKNKVLSGIRDAQYTRIYVYILQRRNRMKSESAFKQFTAVRLAANIHDRLALLATSLSSSLRKQTVDLKYSSHRAHSRTPFSQIILLIKLNHSYKMYGILNISSYYTTKEIKLFKMRK